MCLSRLASRPSSVGGGERRPLRDVPGRTWSGPVSELTCPGKSRSCGHIYPTEGLGDVSRDGSSLALSAAPFHRPALALCSLPSPSPAPQAPRDLQVDGPLSPPPRPRGSYGHHVPRQPGSARRGLSVGGRKDSRGFRCQGLSTPRTWEGGKGGKDSPHSTPRRWAEGPKGSLQPA